MPVAIHREPERVPRPNLSIWVGGLKEFHDGAHY